MAMIEINWHPEDRQLKQFGVIALVATILLSVALHFLKGLPLEWMAVIIGFGIITFITSLVYLKATKYIFLGLTLITLPIGYVVSFVVMAVFYFLVITPVALVFRIFGRDPLNRKFKTEEATYWEDHKITTNIERYFHQF